MKKQIIILLFMIVALASCSKDEPLIDNSNNSWKLLAVTGSGLTKISKIEQPSGDIIEEDILAKYATGHTPTNEISKIVAYGSRIYVLIPKDYKIIMLDRWNYSFVAEIDLSANKLEPTAIAFANATDAYIVHKNADKVSLLDIKFNKIANTFTVGKTPTDIVCSKSKIVVTNSKSNTLSVIDARTYTKLADVATKEVPYYLAAAPVTGLVAVVCAGNGKFDNSTATRTAAQIQLFNPDTKSITYTAEIKNIGFNSADLDPSAIAVTEKDLAFVSTQKALFMLNVKTPNNVILVKKEEYSGVVYNFTKLELIVLKSGYSAFSASQTNGKFTYSLVMPPLFGAVLSI